MGNWGMGDGCNGGGKKLGEWLGCARRRRGAARSARGSARRMVGPRGGHDRKAFGRYGIDGLGGVAAVPRDAVVARRPRGAGERGGAVGRRWFVTRSNDQAVQVSNLPLIRSGLSKMGLDCYQSAVNWSLRPG